MEWQGIPDTGAKIAAQHDQLHHIEALQQAAAVHNAEVSFDYQAAQNFPSYLADLEDSLRYTALSFFKNPQRDHVLAERILRQWSDASISSEQFPRRADRARADSVRRKLEELIITSSASMTDEQHRQADECLQAVDLIPVLRHTALNVLRREELGMLDPAYQHLKRLANRNKMINTLLLILLVPLALGLFLWVSQYLLPMPLFSGQSLLFMVVCAALAAGGFMLLHREKPDYSALEIRCRSLSEEIWGDLTSQEIQVAREYLHRNSQELNALIQRETELVERILGSDWERAYRGDFLLMY